MQHCSHSLRVSMDRNGGVKFLLMGETNGISLIPFIFCVLTHTQKKERFSKLSNNKTKSATAFKKLKTI